MKQKNSAIIVASIVSGVILVISILALLLLKSSIPSNGENTLTVQGISSVKAFPDLITINFNIETKADTVSEAEEKNSEKFEQFISNLEVKDISKDKVITENFNIYPNTYWEDGKRIEDGFIASHQVKIELSSEEKDLVGSIVDAGVEAEIAVSYINFELTQESQNYYKAQAMEFAAEDARIKAESTAAGFNKEIGKLVSVSVNDFGYYPWNVYSTRDATLLEEAAGAKAAIANIQPGEKEISSMVSATFKLV